ncbi:MAG TPA: phosphatidylglycerophosphatase A [Acidisarcina sp.]|nr:phosphatidylglycerophosphatase A [Acidisarcina sp.]
MSRFPGLKTRWAWVVGTFFGAGLGKPGPGTWGSIAALLLWWLLAHFAAPSTLHLALITAAAALLATVIGIPAGTIVARETGREDPGHVVVDEAVGQWIALIACPVDWRHPLLALLLFRAFDIVKPWPARQLENLPGGWGIMLDDVAAGLYALLILQFARHWF